jgi:hypothetical protein
MIVNIVAIVAIILAAAALIYSILGARAARRYSRGDRS